METRAETGREDGDWITDRRPGQRMGEKRSKDEDWDRDKRPGQRGEEKMRIGAEIGDQSREDEGENRANRDNRLGQRQE